MRLNNFTQSMQGLARKLEGEVSLRVRVEDHGDILDVTVLGDGIDEHLAEFKMDRYKQAEATMVELADILEDYVDDVQVEGRVYL